MPSQLGVVVCCSGPWHGELPCGSRRQDIDDECMNDRVNREALWSVLQIYVVGGQLLNGIQAFYREANACVRVRAKFSENFAVEVGVSQGCVLPPWLFNIFMDGCMKEIKSKVVKRKCKVEVKWRSLVCCKMPFCG